MRAFSVCEYLTSGETLAPDHYDPDKIVKALKGRDLGPKRYYDCKISGRWSRINEANKDLVFPWAAEQLGPAIAETHPTGPLTIVPVPSHTNVTVDQVQGCRMFKLAEAIVAWLRQQGRDADTAAIVHWTQVLLSAHDGGSRDPSALQRFMAVDDFECFLNLDRTVVIVDDVVTSGARLTACTQTLLAKGMKVYDLAFAVARTVHVKGQPFAPLIETCPREIPEPPPAGHFLF